MRRLADCAKMCNRVMNPPVGTRDSGEDVLLGEVIAAAQDRHAHLLVVPRGCLPEQGASVVFWAHAGAGGGLAHEPGVLVVGQGGQAARVSVHSGPEHLRLFQHAVMAANTRGNGQAPAGDFSAAMGKLVRAPGQADREQPAVGREGDSLRQMQQGDVVRVGRSMVVRVHDNFINVAMNYSNAVRAVQIRCPQRDRQMGWVLSTDTLGSRQDHAWTDNGSRTQQVVVLQQGSHEAELQAASIVLLSADAWGVHGRLYRRMYTSSCWRIYSSSSRMDWDCVDRAAIQSVFGAQKTTLDVDLGHPSC